MLIGVNILFICNIVYSCSGFLITVLALVWHISPLKCFLVLLTLEVDILIAFECCCSLHMT
jgi:hypothetical protein